MKKINILIAANLLFAIIFSCMNICIAADVSCLSFILSSLFTAVVVYFVGFKFAKKQEHNKAFMCRKLIQYESFIFLIAFILRRAGEKGTVFAFDLVSVIFWLIIFITACIISYCLDFKHFEKITGIKIKEVKNENVGKMLSHGKTRDGKKTTGLSYLKWFVFEILDWGDALLQAVFLVLLFQIFFFQFYKIPTESMVPEYMVNDRVAVSKITAGPKFPLTDVGLPCLKKYKRGDIVVFRNPHYTINRQSEVKTVVSQLVYMFTFTFVNTNLDEHGVVKADPLVKRITGVEGEQLMMQDGVLYSRTKENPQFTPVEQDALWAAYNLNAESPEVKKYIKDMVISAEGFETIEAIEAERRAINVAEMMKECVRISKEFKAIAPKTTSDNIENAYYAQFLKVASPYEMNHSLDYTDLARALLSNEGGAQWFENFMSEWCESYDNLLVDNYVGGNLYDDSCFKMNLMFKYYAGTLVLETAKAVNNGISSNDIAKNPVIIQCSERIRLLQEYMRFIMNFRNMPVFPENIEGNPQYIPENCFFMMGDNRFNSFDMRHRDELVETKITPFDNYSFSYYSNVNPIIVPQKLILGSTGFRFWPLSRPVRASKIK